MGAEFDLVLASCDAVREVRGASCLHTHGMQFGYLFSQRQQQGHGAKRHAFVIEVEARHNDAVALVGQFVAHFRESLIEELGLVDVDFATTARTAAVACESGGRPDLATVAWALARDQFEALGRGDEAAEAAERLAQ